MGVNIDGSDLSPLERRLLGKDNGRSPATPAGLTMQGASGSTGSKVSRKADGSTTPLNYSSLELARNRRVLLCRLVFAAMLISGATYVHVRRATIFEDSKTAGGILRAPLQLICSAIMGLTSPGPGTVELPSELLRVSTIAMADPRLAVINGSQVAEGDQISIRPTGRSGAITLRVTKIAEQEVELTDGVHTIIARLPAPALHRLAH